MSFIPQTGLASGHRCSDAHITCASVSPPHQQPTPSRHPNERTGVPVVQLPQTKTLREHANRPRPSATPHALVERSLARV